MVFKFRIPITYQSRGAQHKATICRGERPDQIVNLEATAQCKSDLSRPGYAQDLVRDRLMLLILSEDKRPIACLSYLPHYIIEEDAPLTTWDERSNRDAGRQ